MRNRMLILGLAVVVALSATAAKDEVNEAWQKLVLAAVDSFPECGGYYVGRKTTSDFPRTAWRGMNEAYKFALADPEPQINLQKAQPSFCSMATYLCLLKALTMFNHDFIISREAWLGLKPYCGVVDALNPKGYNQVDGEGCWGRANANGPGIAILVNDVKAGYSFTGYRGAKTEKNKENPKEMYLSDEQWRADEVWSRARPGDFMKIFWNRNETKGSDSGAVIGVNEVKEDEQEHGHSVVFLGYTADGQVRYWSSNGPGEHPVENGYGIAACDKAAIQRVVFTRIVKPENFNNAKSIYYNNVHKWLSALDGKKHGTTSELKKYCGLK